MTDPILSKAHSVMSEISGNAFGSFEDGVEIIAKALREAGPQWQPIETAPRKDGESVLLGWNVAGCPAVMGFWSGDYHGLNAWCDEHYESDFTPQPTHWMPIPAAPEAN